MSVSFKAILQPWASSRNEDVMWELISLYNES